MKEEISLIHVQEGKKVRVVRFDGAEGGSHERHIGYVRRLEEMGILPQEVLEVLRNGRIGPVEVIVKGSHLVMGRGIASKIIVEEING